MCENKIKFETNIMRINLNDFCGKLLNSFFYFDSLILSKRNQFDLFELCNLQKK